LKNQPYVSPLFGGLFLILSMNKKYVITIGPQGLGNVLTKQEFESLINIIDKAATAGFNIELAYTEITNEMPEDQKSSVQVAAGTL
jgi:hypothetical protein